jgi:hypothetical protein
MADVTVTAANLRIIESIEARTITAFAAAAITKGQACYINSSGNAALARANAVATGPAVGIATHDAAAGASVTLLYHGRLAGFTLGNPGTLVYLSETTAGALADAAPDGSPEFVQPVGRVMEMTDTAGTEYLFVDINLAFLPVAL